jgi:hypothetical protein
MLNSTAIIRPSNRLGQERHFSCTWQSDVYGAEYKIVKSELCPCFKERIEKSVELHATPEEGSTPIYTLVGPTRVVLLLVRIPKVLISVISHIRFAVDLPLLSLLLGGKTFSGGRTISPSVLENIYQKH